MRPDDAALAERRTALSRLRLALAYVVVACFVCREAALGGALWSAGVAAALFAPALIVAAGCRRTARPAQAGRHALLVALTLGTSTGALAIMAATYLQDR